MTGTVHWFNDKFGYGFIQSKEHESFYVHYTAIRTRQNEYRTLQEGARVRFEPKHGPRGLYARNVRVLH